MDGEIHEKMSNMKKQNKKHCTLRNYILHNENEAYFCVHYFILFYFIVFYFLLP